MADRNYRSLLASNLAEALSAQSRFDKGWQMSEQAKATAIPDDLDPQARWKIITAKLLAQRGQFPAADRLLGEVEAALPPGTGRYWRPRRWRPKRSSPGSPVQTPTRAGTTCARPCASTTASARSRLADCREGLTRPPASLPW
jgi:hypothetical protein